MPDRELFKKIIAEQHSFVLTTHVNPDGDGLGCEMAIKYFLQKMGKNVSVINHSETPQQYDFLDPLNEIMCFENSKDAATILSADCIIILDTNQGNRLRSMENAVKKSSAKKIIIDHHLDEELFADHYIISDTFASTVEIVYHLLTSFRPQFDLDTTIATNLYIAIMTDSGSFRFPRTNSAKHHIVADLLSFGVDPTAAFANVYERWSRGRMLLLGRALDTMQFAYDGKLAYIICAQKMFEETNTSEIETDNFTTYPMSIEGVVAGILINELDNGVKISFRSKGKIPINELAKEYGGGGHKNAAGARVFDVQLENIVKDIIARAGKYLHTKIE